MSPRMYFHHLLHSGRDHLHSAYSGHRWKIHESAADKTIASFRCYDEH